MLSLLVLMTLTLASPTDSGALEARGEAADILRSTLTVLDASAEGQPHLPGLLAAAGAASDTLRGSPLGDGLRTAMKEARSAQTAEPGPAAQRLEDVIRRTLADLEFQPVLEANLPEGFPAPTPVGEIELKRYPRYRIARTGSGGNGAFWQLFLHIQKHEIPMTAPVEMTYDTAGDEVGMAFMYEHAAQGSTGPDGSVEVVDIEPMLVASIGCRGWSSDAAVEQALARLSAWIAAQGELEIAGPTRQFGYNSPSVRGDRRYFEVQIPVRARVAEQPAADVARR